MPDGWLHRVADMVKYWGFTADEGWSMTWRDTIFWCEEAGRILQSTGK